MILALVGIGLTLAAILVIGGITVSMLSNYIEDEYERRMGQGERISRGRRQAQEIDRLREDCRQAYFGLQTLLADTQPVELILENLRAAADGEPRPNASVIAEPEAAHS